MADDTEQIEQNDEQLLQSQLATVCEHLINIAQFELPFVLVLLDAYDNVIGSKIVQSRVNPHRTGCTGFCGLRRRRRWSRLPYASYGT